MRVLIAEDDFTSRRMLEMMLRKWGYSVLVTSDGTEAWSRLQEPDAPKLVVLDWMMPGMDGMELCHRLRGHEASKLSYIILLTAKTQKEDVAAGLNAGANDYITKPFNNLELRARIAVGRRVVELQQTLAERIEELGNARDQVRTLQGLIPVCMYCHKIRTDKNDWSRMEEYMGRHSDAQFSHGLCPDCLSKTMTTTEPKSNLVCA